MTPDIDKMRELAGRLSTQASRRAKGNEGSTVEYQASVAIISLLDALEASKARIKELEAKVQFEMWRKNNDLQGTAFAMIHPEKNSTDDPVKVLP